MGYEDSNQVEIACEVKRTTEKALQIYDGSITEWVPRSLISHMTENKAGEITSIWIPQGIALQKGFI